MPPKVPKGDSHSLVGLSGGVLVEPEGSGSPGAMAGGAPVGAGSPTATPSPGWGVLCIGTTQVHAVGQSASAAQLVAFGVHAPTVLVVIMQVSSGATGALRLAGPLEPVPVPATGVVAPPAAPPVPPPEQAVLTANVHEKPSPQSASAVRGELPLVRARRHALRRAGRGCRRGPKQSAFGGQADPPEHSPIISVWQIIAGPQSASVAHGAWTQMLVTAGTGSGAGSETGQTVPPTHAGAVFAADGGVTTSQVNPFPQSAAVLHPCARAPGATASRALNAPNETRTLPSDMADLRS